MKTSSYVRVKSFVLLMFTGPVAGANRPRNLSRVKASASRGRCLPGPDLGWR